MVDVEFMNSYRDRLEDHLNKAKQSLTYVDYNLKKFALRQPPPVLDDGGSVGQRRSNKDNFKSVDLRHNILKRRAEKLHERNNEITPAKKQRYDQPSKIYNYRASNTTVRIRRESDDRENVRVHRRLQDNEMDDDMPNKPAIQSYVVAKPVIVPSRIEAASTKTYTETKARDRRMFNALIGTLQKFKQEENRMKDKEDKKAKVEQKLEEAAKLEREKVREEKQKLIQARKDRENFIKAVENHLSRVKEQEEWEEMQKPLANYIRTKTDPHLYYLPKVVCEKTKELLEESGEQFRNELKSQREALKKEGEDIMEQFHVRSLDEVPGGIPSPENAANSQQNNVAVSDDSRPVGIVEGPVRVKQEGVKLKRERDAPVTGPEVTKEPTTDLVFIPSDVTEHIPDLADAPSIPDIARIKTEKIDESSGNADETQSDNEGGDIPSSDSTSNRKIVQEESDIVHNIDDNPPDGGSPSDFVQGEELDQQENSENFVESDEGRMQIESGSIENVDRKKDDGRKIEKQKTPEEYEDKEKEKYRKRERETGENKDKESDKDDKYGQRYKERTKDRGIDKGRRKYEDEKREKDKERDVDKCGDKERGRDKGRRRYEDKEREKDKDNDKERGREKGEARGKDSNKDEEREKDKSSRRTRSISRTSATEKQGKETGKGRRDRREKDGDRRSGHSPSSSSRSPSLSKERKVENYKKLEKKYDKKIGSGSKKEFGRRERSRRSSASSGSSRSTSEASRSSRSSSRSSGSSSSSGGSTASSSGSSNSGQK